MKKYFKSYIFFALMAFALAGCKMDDLRDDVNDLNDRVTLLEEQVKILNENLEVMAYILNPENRTIQSVKVEGGKYNITLSNGDELVLNIGSEGEVFEPTVTISEDGFWVINGEQTTVKAQGEAGNNLVPEFRIEGGKWQVRYGNGGDWQTVQGEYNIDNVGDRFFESAAVEGDIFVIMARDGETIYKLPIVKGLSCVINQTGETEGYIVFASGERKEINVKIEADNVSAPVYPQGWRAELAPKAETGADGFNYVLTVYAPSAKTLSSRASANNGEDIVIRVNKGAFWAVDKIKVKVEKSEPGYTTKKEKYDNGQTIDVNGFSIDIVTYGSSKDIPENNTITEDGVYFMSDELSGTELTLNFSTDVSKLILINESENRPVLNIDKTHNLIGTFVLDNVDVNIKATTDIFAFSASNSAKMVINNSKVTGLDISKGLVKEGAENPVMDLFSISNSDFSIFDNESSSVNLYLLSGLTLCKKYDFINNIVAYQTTNETANELGDKAKLTNFKLFNNNKNGVINELNITGNTFINLGSYTISSGKVSPTGLVYVLYIGTSYDNNNKISSGAKLVINNNIFYSELTSTSKITSMFIRYACKQIAGDISLGDNKAYVAYNTGEFKYFYTSGTTNIAPEGVINNKYDAIKAEGLFDTTNGAVYDFDTFTFKPARDYTSYGAQR